jgi:hypothetical protein
MDQVTLRWFSRDLNSRGALVANALSDSLAEALLSNKVARLQSLFDRTSQDERLFAIGLCSPEGKLLQKTDRFPPVCPVWRLWSCPAMPSPTLALTGGQVLVGVHDVMGHRPVAPQAVDIPRARRAARRGQSRPEAQQPAELTPGAAARPELHRPPQPGHAATT